MGADHNILFFRSRNGNSGTRTTPAEVPILQPISELEVSILAVLLFNKQDAPLSMGEIYRRSASVNDPSMFPYAHALVRLISRGFVVQAAAWRFDYELSRSGMFALSSVIFASEFTTAITKIQEFADCLSGKASPAAQCKEGAVVGQTAAPRILPDPLARISIVKKSEEVHLNFCFTDCGRVASGKCECGNPVCSVHRYNAQGDREPNGGFCVMCSAVPQDSTEVFSNGRQV